MMAFDHGPMHYLCEDNRRLMPSATSVPKQPDSK